MIKYFTIEDLLKHYLQKKFHILQIKNRTGTPYVAGPVLFLRKFIPYPSHGLDKNGISGI